MGIIKAIYLLIRAFLISRLSLAAEILALRQQVAVYKHTVKRPKLRTRDRGLLGLALQALVQLAVRP